jgi:hypothetical protein
MTKVLITEYFLAYQRGMDEFVRQIVKEKYIAGVKSGGHAEPSWIPADLLPSPKVESLDLDFYEGRVDDIISIYTSDDFGIINLYLILKDENGNLIESGNAIDWPEEPNRWAYITRVTVPAGTSVTVHAAVIDGFGGMSTRSERIT